MGSIRFSTILPLIVLASTLAQAQEGSVTWNVRHWEYHYFKDWKAVGDKVYGKAEEDNAEYFYLHTDHFTEIGGVRYMMVCHMPSSFPIDSRGQQEVMSSMNTQNGERRYYSIGIRREKGKVYANREDFLYYQNYIRNNTYVSACLISFGNPDYQPYHLTDDGSEVILYDYTMEVGGAYRHVDGYEDIFVTRKDTVAYLDQLPRRRLTLSNGLILVEGMGCINSNGMLIDYLNPAAEYQRNYTYLARCTDSAQEQVYYDHEAAGLHVEDLGTLGISGSHSKTDLMPSFSYDLQGRRAGWGNGWAGTRPAPTSGVYIKDGRKILVH